MVRLERCFALGLVADIARSQGSIPRENDAFSNVVLNHLFWIPRDPLLDPKGLNPPQCMLSSSFQITLQQVEVV